MSKQRSGRKTNARVTQKMQLISKADFIKAGKLGFRKERTKKVGYTKKQTLGQKIIIALGVTFMVLVIGLVSRWDYEYENRPNICRTVANGEVFCYKP